MGLKFSSDEPGIDKNICLLRPSYIKEILHLFAFFLVPKYLKNIILKVKFINMIDILYSNINIVQKFLPSLQALQHIHYHYMQTVPTFFHQNSLPLVLQWLKSFSSLSDSKMNSVLTLSFTEGHKVQFQSLQPLILNIISNNSERCQHYSSPACDNKEYLILTNKLYKLPISLSLTCECVQQ